MITSCAYCNKNTGEPNGPCYFRISNELVWHSNCFKCGYGEGTVGCRRQLLKKNSKILKSTPYCFACYELALYRENCKQNDTLFEMLDQTTKSSVTYNVKEKDAIQIEFEETQTNIIVPPADNINICFVGGVSTGKSTILNAIFCEELTQCKIKRTTMVPTIYIENESNPFNITPSEEIFKLISEKNQEIIKKTENGEKISKNEYSELAFNVGKLDINILDDAYVNVYDIPGLNDARTKDIYYNYLEENFLKFNLVIFIVDIHSGLNTSDEIDIVNFITNNTRYQLEENNKKIYTLVIVNKADDMQLDEESDETDKLILTGELNEMYEQVEKTIRTEFSRKNIGEQLIGIIPLCAIDSYLYRMVKKHGKDFKLTPEQILKIGINENGKKFSTLKPATQEKKVYEILQDKEFINTMIKLSGFSCLEKTLHKFLGENNTGKTIRVNNLLFNLSKLPNLIDIFRSYDKITVKTRDVEKLFEKYNEIYENIKKIDANQYNLLIIEFVDQIRMILENKTTKYCDVTPLLDDYNEFVENILNVYFIEYYDTTDYPEFIKKHCLFILYKCISESSIFLTVSLCDIFKTLKTINCYNEHFVNIAIQMIIKRSENNRYAFDFEKNGSCEMLIELLSNLKKDGYETIKLVRFIVIYNIKSNNESDEITFTRKMLYQMHNEIPVYNYICQMLYGKMADEIVFINGLDDTETISNEFKLDLYYLDLVKNITNKERNQKTTISL
jgi:GTP-binding protein EngB required for normal cell division